MRHVTVKKGETLGKYAAWAGVRLTCLRKLNNCHHFVAGQRVKIPVRKSFSELETIIMDIRSQYDAEESQEVTQKVELACLTNGWTLCEFQEHSDKLALEAM